MFFQNSSFDSAIRISRITVISIGVVLNIFSFVVFSRKTFRNNSISTYFRALSIFQCLIIIELTKDIPSFISNTLFFNMSDATCKLYFYLSLQSSSIPGWILVAFSIDKMLNMKRSPPKILKSKLFQWSVVAGIVLFHLVFFSELLIILKLEPLFFNPYIRICNFPILSYFYVLVYVNLAESCFIPFLIMSITSCITIRLLMKSSRSLKRISSNVSFRQRKIRDMKYAISSISLNVIFISFKTPLIIFPLLPMNEFNYYFSEIALFLFLFDCSTTFFIHIATNQIFRREFFAVFTTENRTNRLRTQANSIRHVSKQQQFQISNNQLDNNRGIFIVSYL